MLDVSPAYERCWPRNFCLQRRPFVSCVFGGRGSRLGFFLACFHDNVLPFADGTSTFRLPLRARSRRRCSRCDLGRHRSGCGNDFVRNRRRACHQSSRGRRRHSYDLGPAPQPQSGHTWYSGVIVRMGLADQATAYMYSHQLPSVVSLASRLKQTQDVNVFLFSSCDAQTSQNFYYPSKSRYQCPPTHVVPVFWLVCEAKWHKTHLRRLTDMPVSHHRLRLDFGACHALRQESKSFEAGVE